MKELVISNERKVIVKTLSNVQLKSTFILPHTVASFLRRHDLLRKKEKGNRLRADKGHKSFSVFLSTPLSRSFFALPFSLSARLHVCVCVCVCTCDVVGECVHISVSVFICVFTSFLFFICLYCRTELLHLEVSIN